jgi:hypothetical protein
MTYQPRGGTPLIDAALKTIAAVEDSLAKYDTVPKVIVCIQTDGEENSSTEHTWEELKQVVAEKTKKGWQFNFMGTGIDAYDQGARMGIAAANTMSTGTSKAVVHASFAAAGLDPCDLPPARLTIRPIWRARARASGDRFSHQHVPPAAQPAQPQKLDLSTPPATPSTPTRRRTVGDLSL